MKAVIQAVFPWKATGLDTFSGKKNDRIIHNSVPNPKQRKSPRTMGNLLRRAGWYSPSSLCEPTLQTRKQTLQSRCRAVVPNQHAVSRHDHTLLTTTTFLILWTMFSLTRLNFPSLTRILPCGFERNPMTKTQKIVKWTI